MVRFSFKSIATNSIMLLLMNIAKMVFPLLTLPYLTRVLSTESYGVVAYVKAVMSYMQIVVDFGFILSATKDIVNAGNDNGELGRITLSTILAKLMLCIVAFSVLIVLIIKLPILSSHSLYTVLSFVVVTLSIFLLDFLFRGLERMHVITIRYVAMRGIATALTFAFVHGDGDILWIPTLDIIGSIVAIALVWKEFTDLNISLKYTGFMNIISNIKNSAVYFVSNMASTSFNVLNTIILGVMLTTTEIAYWSVCMQLVTAVQALYNPIINGVYPVMMQNKELKIIKTLGKIFVPLVACGCILAWILAEVGLTIIGGLEYASAAPIFRFLTPVLFFAFPGMLCGWPTLGAIGKEGDVSRTTVISVVFQILGLLYLFTTDSFTLINIAILRSLTEFVLFALRFRYVVRYRFEFS